MACPNRIACSVDQTPFGSMRTLSCGNSFAIARNDFQLIVRMKNARFQLVRGEAVLLLESRAVPTS